MLFKSTSLLALCVMALVVRCAVAPVAGGSDNPDFIVVGAIKDVEGQPAQQTVVTIVPATYNPVVDPAPETFMTDTTNASGTYRVAVSKEGAYSIQAVHLRNRTRLFQTDIQVADSLTVADAAALTVPGSVKILLPDSGVDAANGYVYIPGTSRHVPLGNSGDTVTIDSLPAGILTSVNYASTTMAGSVPLRCNVPVYSGDTTMVLNPAWKYARRITLNTSATGAGITAHVTGFPVLIRLDEGMFDFFQAQPDGADLRFAKHDNTFLPYETERWDVAARRAEIWVKVDTVFGNNSSQAITMYWGNPAAARAANGAGVFDTTAGFRGVWHLGESSGESITDATVNRVSGAAIATSHGSGAIGIAQRFDGRSSLIQVDGSGGVMDFPENGFYSVSAWVNIDSTDTLYQGIVYSSNFQYGLQVRPGGVWEFFTFVGGIGWEGSRSTALTGAWHLLTGVRNGTRQYLYVDGLCVDSTKTIVTSPLARVPEGRMEIGHCPDGGLEPDRFFRGSIDEVRVSGAVSGAAWIRLSYMNQKEPDALVMW
jgi:hypothetical protein